MHVLTYFRIPIARSTSNPGRFNGYPTPLNNLGIVDDDANLSHNLNTILTLAVGSEEAVSRTHHCSYDDTEDELARSMSSKRDRYR